MIIIATIIYLNVILYLYNAILPPTCHGRWFKQKIAGPAASFALSQRVLQTGVMIDEVSKLKEESFIAKLCHNHSLLSEQAIPCDDHEVCCRYVSSLYGVSDYFQYGATEVVFCFLSAERKYSDEIMGRMETC